MSDIEIPLTKLTKKQMELNYDLKHKNNHFKMNGEIYLVKNLNTGLYRIEFHQPDNDIQKQFYSTGDLKLIMTINRTEKEFKQLLNQWDCYKTLCGWYNDKEDKIFDTFFEENYPFIL